MKGRDDEDVQAWTHVGGGRDDGCRLPDLAWNSITPFAYTTHFVNTQCYLLYQLECHIEPA